VRELAPAFLFAAAISAFATPKQQKSRSLESISYEMQSCKSLVLIFMQIAAGWGTVVSQLAPFGATELVTLSEVEGPRFPSIQAF
jgi:hypothetical protein